MLSTSGSHHQVPSNAGRMDEEHLKSPAVESALPSKIIQTDNYFEKIPNSKRSASIADETSVGTTQTNDGVPREQSDNRSQDITMSLSVPPMHMNHQNPILDSWSSTGLPRLARPHSSHKELPASPNEREESYGHGSVAPTTYQGNEMVSAPIDNGSHQVQENNQQMADSALSSNIDLPKMNYSEKINIEESEEQLLNRLGRERPKIFNSLWAEIACCFSICMSQILCEYWVSGFTVILPTVSRALNIPAASSTWPASAFSLTIASFLLIMGRFADMYGGKLMYVLGMAWLTLWSLVGGFSQNELMLDFCRALQGLGPAAFLPSGLSLLGGIYRPGPRKNVAFCLYGACAAAGFFLGILFAGTAAQAKGADWRLYFWVGTALTFITALSAFFFIPTQLITRNKNVKMDWLGAGLISSGLILFTFAITDSAHAPRGWKTPYVYVLFIVGILVLCLAGYVECNIATDPLLPASLFKVKYMPALTIALFLTYGSLGIFLLYATYYMLNILVLTPMQVVAWYTPLFMGGIFISLFGGTIMHRVPGTVLCAFGSVAWIAAPLLFALAPEGANYWAFFFTSMVCATLGIDITFNVSNILITSSFPKAQQGLAGSWCMILMHLGIAVLLGFADVVATFTEYQGVKQSYKNTFWLEVACAGVALVCFMGFVRVEAAESEFTVEEKEERRIAAEG